MAKKLLLAAASLLLMGAIGVVLSADETTVEVASAPANDELWGAAVMFASDDAVLEVKPKPIELASGDDSFEDISLTNSLPNSSTLKTRLIKAASSFADSGDEAEIQKMTEELEAKNIEASARGRLREAEQALQKLADEHPNTAAGKRAAQMLAVPAQ